jgi:hypothetical protein
VPLVYPVPWCRLPVRGTALEQHRWSIDVVIATSMEH